MKECHAVTLGERGYFHVPKLSQNWIIQFLGLFVAWLTVGFKT